MVSYWTSMVLWDLSIFVVFTFSVLAVLLMYGKESARVFVGNFESVAATFLLVLGFGASVTPFSYLMARNAKNPQSCQVAVVGTLFVFGFVAVNAYFIMSQLETTERIAESLRPVFRFWPGVVGA